MSNSRALQTAIILAGGQGTRLRPLTDVFPKPLARIANRPMLEHVLYGLRCQNIHQIALATGYKAVQIEEYFGAGESLDINLSYFVEEYPLGNGGALRNLYDQAPHFLKETFLVANADILHDIDLQAALRFHRGRGALATLVSVEVENPGDFGVLEIDEENRVLAFHEKPPPGVTNSRWANTAIWIFESQVAPMIEPGHSMIEEELFPRLLRQGLPIYAYRHDGYWLDVGTLTRYLQANRDALQGRFPCDLKLPAREPEYFAGRAQVAADAVIEKPVLLADGCAIESGAMVKSTVLGENAHIESSALVEDAVLYESTRIGAGAQVRRCVLGPGVSVPSGQVLEDRILFEEV